MIGTLLSATDLYRSFVTDSFASKQPHFTLINLDRTTALNDDSQFISALESTPGVFAVSPYAKSLLWGQFSATTTQLGGVSHSSKHDKFSTGYFTVIGVNKQSPSIVSWETINFYSAGIYRTTITNLEFEYEWVKNPQLVVPNAVFDASFYPPISQEAHIKNQYTEDVWQVKAFIQDHFDDARIYVGINTFNMWLDTQHELTEQGLYIRMQHDYSLPLLRDRLKALCHSKCSVNSWLDQHVRKSKVLTVFEAFSWSMSLTISILSLLLVGLYMAKSVMDKSKTINILQVTGYHFNGTLMSIVLVHTMLVFIIFLLYISWVYPWLNTWLNTPTQYPFYIASIAGIFCLLSSFFLMSIFHFTVNKV